MINRLNKIREEINSLQYNNIIYVSADDVEEICKLLSDEARADLRENGYQNYKINFSKLQTNTLIELAEIYLQYKKVA